MMNAIELVSLTKRYQDFTLDALDLTLPSGCTMGLVGENGAGKTTAIKLLLGMLRPDAGSATVLGHAQDARFASVREDIGVVMDDVGYPECLTGEQVRRVMRGIYKHWDDAAYTAVARRLNVPLDKPFKELSRGMRMKLGMAVALSHGARLLVLDEATSGLDPLAREDVLELLNDFTRDEEHSILLSSHIVSDLEKVCDYIAFLHKGKLLLCDEKDALMSRYGAYHCAVDQLSALDPAAILSVKRSPYGADVLLLREKAPHGAALGPVGLEELFVSMMKEEHEQ